MGLRLINFHFALRFTGSVLADIFGMVYLYQIGLEFSSIFLAYAFLHLLRMLTRPFILKVLSNRQFKTGILIGTIFYAVSYLILGQVQGISWLLGAYILWRAVGDNFYWPAYHTYFASLSTKESRGSDIGTKESLVAIARALAPALGGMVITYFGFNYSFIIASLITCIATIPLASLPGLKEKSHVSLRETWRYSDKIGFLAHMGAGWYEAGMVTWSLIVFLLVKSYTLTGLQISLVMIFQIIAFKLIGKYIDRGNGRILSYITAFLLTIVILGRAGIVQDIPSIILFDIMFAIAGCFYGPVLDTILYNLAAESKNMWKFQLISETSVDIGYMIGWIAGAIITYAGFDIRWLLLWSLGGVIVMLMAFLRYYPSVKYKSKLSTIK